MNTRIAFLTPILVAVIVAFPVAGQPRGLTTQDALDVRQIAIADATDDARWVAAVVSTRRGRTDTDHFRFGDPTYIAPRYGELLVVDTREGDARPLSEGPIQVRGPTWSPDGTRLAYYRRDGDSYDLHVYDVTSSTDQEVVLESDKRLSSTAPLAWSPDGTRLVVALRPVGWAEEARAAFLEMTEGPVVVQDSRNDFLAWDRVRNLDAREIPALVSVEGGAVEELLGETPIQSVRFAEDGSAVLYQVAKRVKTGYGRRDGTEYSVHRLPLSGEPEVVMEPTERRIRLQWNDAGTALAYADDGDVFFLPLGADSASNLTADHRQVVEDGDTTELSFSVLAWRPDGAALLVSSEQGWHLLQASGGPPEMVLTLEEDEDARPERDLEGWSDDGRYLYVSYSAPDRWWRGLQRLDIRSGDVTDIIVDEGLYRDWTLSKDGRTAVYRRSDGDRPDELWVMDTRDGAARPLTDLNPQLDEVTLARTELVEYLDVDGNTLYGILYYPPGYEAGRTYPLVVEVYERFFHNGYNENMNLVTAQGWLGFRPSVEFEQGYPGEAWLKAVPNAINKLIERGMVDPARVAVYGQSYGGYAVNLLVAQTDRFAAAANVSGKVNIISFLGDSPRITTRNYDAAEVGQDRIGATLWEQPHKYIQTSAVMFADRIDTPLLLLSGEGDWNVPATNQREMYYALRRLGKEVVWVNYMKGGHGAGRASTAEDFHDHWRRMFDWFRAHFEDEGAATADRGG
jgi:dipeptidyl aminopeptidase/acylaminoacyl peptidase